MLVGCALLCTSCLGAGHATGRLYQYNQGFENKWAQEGMFLLMLPGYILTSAGDNLIFNSIQWWTGENPIDPPEDSGPSEFGL
jgi:hypothetical protein